LHKIGICASNIKLDDPVILNFYEIFFCKTLAKRIGDGDFVFQKAGGKSRMKDDCIRY
jgi:hypothetical protein